MTQAEFEQANIHAQAGSIRYKVAGVSVKNKAGDSIKDRLNLPEI